ncbi:unnamed protein product [Vitrella brassicaformis CCMP3155]|uniref:Importin subunit alpha n=1 Tax=Vitrella brassicaformis (strain CCMP3155) TaxID=1169540 RepID=A0A0G4GHF6_VITBC|nr:unnamed protein product [Vitrella brassicaformis CCMP3155]|eukprot:CEM29156.1 unnamed protein product [Vitrella brassicaformis CCMP3155]
MESSGSTEEAVSTTDGHPSPQAVLNKARDLYKSNRTKEAYDQSVQQRGLDAVEADIAATMTDICNLIASASASDPQLCISAIGLLPRLLLIEHMAGTIEEKAIDAGLVPVLVEQLSGCDKVQKPAALALSRLARHHSDLVVDAGAVPPLVQLVSSADDNVRGAAIAALCIITTESSTCRDAVLAAGVLQPLLKAMRESSNVAVLTGSAYLLCYLWSVSENSPHPVPLAELVPFLPVLVGLIAAPQQDDNVLQCARGALQQFVIQFNEQGTDADLDALVECGAVASIKPLLQMAEPKIKAVACAIVQFLALGSTAHVQTLIDGGLVPLLVDLVASGDSDADLKKRAAANIGSIVVRGSQQQIDYVVECGGIRPICDLLNGAEDDGEVLESILSALDDVLSVGRQKQANEGLPDNPYCTLLEQAGGVDKVAALQTHNDMGSQFRRCGFCSSISGLVWMRSVCRPSISSMWCRPPRWRQTWERMMIATMAMAMGRAMTRRERWRAAVRSRRDRS